MDRRMPWAGGGPTDVLSFAGWALQQKQSAGSSSRTELKLPGNLHLSASFRISQDFHSSSAGFRERGVQNAPSLQPDTGRARFSLDVSFPVIPWLVPTPGSSPHLIPAPGTGRAVLAAPEGNLSPWGRKIALGWWECGWGSERQGSQGGSRGFMCRAWPQ